MFRLRNDDGKGIMVGSWPRRLLLAWALQAGDLLSELPAGTRVDWRLSPEDRLSQLAPFTDWAAPTARVIDGNLVWLVTGYLASSTFPLSSRVAWHERQVGSVRAAFLGTVSAESGATHVYLQPGTDALAEAWSELSDGVVEPASAIPEFVLRAAAYPGDLFRVQAQALEQAPWKAGNLGGVGQGNGEPPPPQIGWAADTSGPLMISGFESSAERRLSAILVGSREEGRSRLTLYRLDSATTLPVRGVLENRWSNFPSYDALNDSIREDGGTLERGPLRLDVGPGGAVAYQGYFAPRSSGGMVLAWVSVAANERLGAGRNLPEAWSNLLGTSVPAPPGNAQSGRLEEARHWLQRADSALRNGDWSEFGRSWSSLRTVLGVPVDSSKF
jgi:hypothetical protein